MNDKDMDLLKDIFVPQKDLILILDGQAAKTVGLLGPKLDAIGTQLLAGNARFKAIDERCAARAKTCPVVNIDARIALAKKEAEGAAELRRIEREARQEERLDVLDDQGEVDQRKASLFEKKWKLYITIAAMLVLTLLGGVVGVVAYAKGLIP